MIAQSLRMMRCNSFQFFCLETQSYLNIQTIIELLSLEKVPFSGVVSLGLCTLHLDLFNAGDGFIAYLLKKKALNLKDTEPENASSSVVMGYSQRNNCLSIYFFSATDLLPLKPTKQTIWVSPCSVLTINSEDYIT